MALISDLLPDVMLYVSGCPEILAEQKIRDAAIEFCNLSGYWQERLDSFETEADKDIYDIDGPTDSVIRHILTMTVNDEVIEPSKVVDLDRRSQGWRTRTDKPRRYILNSPTELMLTPIPDDIYTISMYASLRPSNDATEIPDLLLAFQREVIAAGAIFKLMTIPDRQWTNMASAALFRQQFYRGVKQARIDSNKQYSNAPQFLTPKPFA